MMPCQEEFDIFFSYARSDKDNARKVVDELEKADLKVWIDENEIPDFESLIKNIKNGLECSKALVAYYSINYPNRKWCQWELTSAYIAGQKEGDPLKRTVVINPEAEFAHILPTDFQGALCKHFPNGIDDGELNALALSIKEYVSRIPEVIGTNINFVRPAWYGRQGLPSPHFVGRLRDMWEIHSKLNSTEHTLEPSGTVQVRGMGGIGKSLIVEEYAMRFGSIYEGGIFWLNAAQLDIENSDLELENQLQSLVLELGIPKQQFSSENGKDILPTLKGVLNRYMKEQNLPCLWIVDDIPSGMSNDALRNWLAPNNNARTLITTRNREYSLGDKVELDVLEPDDAYMLLISKVQPKDELDESRAREIIQNLGFHALAVDIASSALRFTSFEELLTTIRNPDEDGLELLSDLSEQLPNGHETSIAKTFIQSIKHLSDDSKEILLISSILAQAPIPKTLIIEIFKIKFDISQSDSNRRILTSLSDLNNHSLITLDDHAETFEVHDLIRRTIKHSATDTDESSLLNLTETIIVALANKMREYSEDVHLHSEIKNEIEHAKILLDNINSPARAALAQHMAEYFHQASYINPAINLYKQLIPYIENEMDEEALPNKHKVLLVMNNDYASSLRAKGEFIPAKDIQKNVLESAVSLYGEEHICIATYKSNLAHTEEDLGFMDDAIDMLKSALDLCQTVHTEEYETIFIISNNLSNALLKRYNKDKSDQDLIDARDISDKLAEQVCESEDISEMSKASFYHLRGNIYEAEGNTPKAKELLETAFQKIIKIAGLRHRNTTEVAWNLYSLLRESGDASSVSIRSEYLDWLKDTDDEELSNDQKWIKQQISE